MITSTENPTVHICLILSIMGHKRILFIGHSHVRNLKKYVNKPKIKPSRRNFRTVARVDFLGVGGKKIDWLLSSAVANKISKFKPDAIFIMLADNDINEDSTPEEIAHRYIATVSSLKCRFAKVSNIMLGQLLPRYSRSSQIPKQMKKFVDHNKYNPIAHSANEIIKAEVSDIDYLSFFYSGFFFPCKQLKYDNNAKYFRPDGVHLSNRGHKKIFRAIRGSIIQFSQCRSSIKGH